MNTSMLSVKELRRDFDKIKQSLESGNSFVLLYRSRPLAFLKPYRKTNNRTKNGLKPQEQVVKLSGGLPIGTHLTPKHINKQRDISYEAMLS